MKILSIRKAKWNEPNRITFDCEARFDDIGWVPFTFNPEDKEPHVVEFKESLLPEYLHKIKDISEEEYQVSLRLKESFLVKNKRDLLLKDSDVLVLPDRWQSYSEEQKNKISDYRQKLRDITKQEGFPFNVTFPTLQVF